MFPISLDYELRDSTDLNDDYTIRTAICNTSTKFILFSRRRSNQEGGNVLTLLLAITRIAPAKV